MWAWALPPQPSAAAKRWAGARRCLQAMQRAAVRSRRRAPHECGNEPQPAPEPAAAIHSCFLVVHAFHAQALRDAVAGGGGGALDDVSATAWAELVAAEAEREAAIKRRDHAGEHAARERCDALRQELADRCDVKPTPEGPV